MFALCSWRCLGVKSLCFVPLGQSQWAEVVCYCHPGPEGPVHPRAHLGSSKRMGKAPTSYGPLGILCTGTFLYNPGISSGNWARVACLDMTTVPLS